jgi:hypothetical protein
MMEPGVHHELIRIAASGFLAREILCMGNRPVPEITLQRAASSPARPQLTLKYRKGAIAIAISPDSRLLASSCWNVVRLTDIQTGRLVRIGAVSSTTPNALAFSPNGKLLLAGTSAGKVEVLETSTLVVEKVLPATQWSIYALAVSPDSATLACCAADGTVQLWDLKSAKKLRTFGVKGERMASLAFSPDGKLLAALNCGGRCNVWNVETGNLVASTDCLGADERTRVGFSRNGATLAIASYGVKIHLWNFVKDKQPTRVHVPDKLVGKPRINGFGFSPLEGRPMNAPLGDFAFGPSCISRDSRTAACVLENGSTAIWDIASRRVRKILPTRREHDTYGGGIRTVSLSPDGHLLAVVSGVGYIDVWQIDGAGKAAPIKQPIDADEWPGPWGPTLNGLQTRLILTPIRPSQEALLGQGGGGREIDQRQIPTAEDVWWQVSLQLRNRTKKKLSFVWPETRRSGAITITREDGQPVKYRVVPGDDPVTWSIPMSMEPAPDFPNIMTLNSILLGRNYEMSRLGKYRIQFPETKAASTLREPVTNPSLPASNVLEFVNGSAVAKQRLHEAGDILRWPAQTSYGRDEPPATTKPAADVPLAKTVHGKVVDEDGKPIAGADVWMMPAWNPAHRRPATHTTSDADGRFTVPVAIVSRQDLQRVGWPYPVGLLWAYAAGHQLNIAYGGNQIYGRDESDVVIQLKPAAKTTFVVLGPDGKPRAGALVEPEFVIATAHYGEPSEEVRAAVTPRTDAKGQAVFTALPRDALISIRVVTDDFGIQTQQLMGLGSIPADQPIRLRQAGRIVGHVTAAKPEWARGVRIILTTGSLRPFPRGSVPSMTTGFAEVESDEHGYFVVPAIAAGEACVNPVNVDENLSVLAEIPDFRHHAVYVHPGETTTLDIPLVPSVAVRGSVRAKDTGKPIPNSWIQVYYGVDPQNVMVSSDAQGNFVAPVLPGRIRLEVMVDNVNKPGEHIQYGDPQQVDVPENVKEFKTPPLELVPTKRIAGQLIDQHDRPVANRTVWVEAGGRAYGYAQSDAKGEFTLTRVPAPIDTAKAEYRVSDIAAAQSSGSANDATEPAKAKVIQASPLVLRVQRSAPVVPYQRSAIMELIGDQATPTLPLRPLGSNLTVDKNGIIWDRGKPVGIWGIKPSEIPSQRR